MTRFASIETRIQTSRSTIAVTAAAGGAGQTIPYATQTRRITLSNNENRNAEYQVGNGPWAVLRRGQTTTISVDMSVTTVKLRQAPAPGGPVSIEFVAELMAAGVYVDGDPASWLISGGGSGAPDTTPPNAPVISSVTENGTHVVVSGTAEAASTVAVTMNGNTQSTTAGGGGAWTVQFTYAQAGSPGSKTISATATDAASNTSTAGTYNHTFVGAGGGGSTAPSGAAIMRVTETADTGFHFLSGIPNETGPGEVTVELEVKIAGAMNGTDMFSIGGPSSSRVMVSLADGAKLNETGMSGTITALGGGWYRVEAVHASAGDSYFTINLFRDYGGSYAGNTNTSVDFGRLRVINAASSTTTTVAISSLTKNNVEVTAV